MVFPELKVLNEVRKIYADDTKKGDIYIISVQHLLETTGSLFEAIIGAGILPDNIYLTGKIYSTHAITSAKLAGLGVNITKSTYPKKLGTYLEALEGDIINMWADLKVRLTNNSTVIILDDGGYTLKNTPEDVLEKCDVFGIEQTTSGIRMQSAFGRFPVIHLAASAAKVLIEPPIVSEAIKIQVGKFIDQLNPKTIGIVGYGHIGKAVAKEFSRKCQILVFDINSEVGNGTFTEIKHCNFLNELYDQAELVIGATGQDISDITWITQSKSNKTLMSVSSGDIEFNSLLKNCEPYLDSEVESPLQVLDLTTERSHSLKILRGGMVANFTGTADSSPGSIIQVTRGLLFSAVLQIINNRTKLKDRSGPIMLDPEMQSKAVTTWFSDQPQRKQDYSTEIIEGFSNIEWIKKYSTGALT